MSNEGILSIFIIVGAKRHRHSTFAIRHSSFIIEWTHKRKNSHYISMIR
ncbi:hypothetical protein D1AOALGA4SA_2931 [Olavius algarvensis Delta 1 endosymbiont]|nr:hypothetical protein D1AOALGA4SA_2931 [Olavius algarvensis Delta 1 endosymbiont]